MRDAVSEAGWKLENRGTFGMAFAVGYSSRTSEEMVRPTDHTLPYRIYGVSRRDREPLLHFIHDALAASGCRIIHSSDAGHAPFRISFETSAGERMGIIAYAYLANQHLTRNRPGDEYRFQLKYGGKQQDNLHQLWQDPYGLYTTLLVGISPAERFFVGFDPVLHSPTKHFISLEFKASFVEEIRRKKWSWRERERRSRSEDPVEVVVGGTIDSFLDYVRFEREACGEDQGHRAFLAERRVAVAPIVTTTNLPGRPDASYVHQLAREFEMSNTAILDLIADARRLKMAVRGWVAEQHLVEHLQQIDGITDCERIEAENSPDIQLRFEGSDLLFVECKNVLRTPAKNGAARVDFQRTRASKADPCSRYYTTGDFDILAACLHAHTERWEYSFALTRQLDPHRKCPGRLSSNVVVDDRWREDIRGILGAAARTI
ncbi:MAG TPA: hypothetical protein VFN10_23785 [Thermoanaerobaculia bacterium]|nr:hypothetical protein [Thermoanaerobaculia bacterium]